MVHAINRSWASQYGVQFTDIPVFMTLAAFLFVSYNNMCVYIANLHTSPTLRCLFLAYYLHSKRLEVKVHWVVRVATGSGCGWVMGDK